MNFLDKLDGEIMIELGSNLRKLRKTHGYNQQQLANQIGVSRRLIGDIEAGRGTSLLVFIKLLKVFNKTEKVLELLKTTSISPKQMFLRNKDERSTS